MKYSQWIALALVAMVGSFVLATATSGAMHEGIHIGAPAPDFTLEDQDGNKVSLSDFSGKIVVLEWFNFDCPFVQRHHENGTMAKLAEKFKDKGVVWLGINSTHYATRADNKKYQKEWNLGYSILSDSSGKVGKLYDAKTTPHMYIVDKGGMLVYNGGIDDDPMGESEKASNYVKTALEELVSNSPVSVAESKPYGCSVKYAEDK
jgi:peroxiredoxin